MFDAQQTHERNAFPAEVNTPGNLLVRDWILLQTQNHTVQGHQDILGDRRIVHAQTLLLVPA